MIILKFKSSYLHLDLVINWLNTYHSLTVTFKIQTKYFSLKNLDKNDINIGNTFQLKLSSVVKNSVTSGVNN